MQSAFLLLGTNLGDRSFHLRQGREKLLALGDLKSVSRIYLTEPWGIADQPEFWNQAVELFTTLSPEDLLIAIKKIELDCGRSDQVRWGPREIDIDILAYENHVLKTERLIIPHPRLSERKFALIPFSEIAPNWSHPVSGKTIEKLIDDCEDQLVVNPLNY